MVQFAFNAATVPPSEPGGAYWLGPVLCQVVRTEVANTSANNGNKMLVLHVTALDGEYRGQSNVIRLNLWHNNPSATDIAQRQLSSICHVTGRINIQDSDQLCGVPFVAIFVDNPREQVDQQSGQKRTVQGCQANDFRFADGRTIREAANGQPASQPYSGAGARPGPQSGAVPQQPAPGAPPQMQNNIPFPGPGGGQPPAMPQGGAPQFQQQPGPQPGFPQPGQAPQFGSGPGNAPQAGFAPGQAPAMGQHGSPQTQPGPAFGTAASGFNPGAPQGFQPPNGPQAGPGPWAGGQPQG